MTRLRRMKRVAKGRAQEYVITLDADTVTLRPKRSRRPEASVSVTWDWIYVKAILARPKPARRKRRVNRGLLSLEREGRQL